MHPDKRSSGLGTAGTAAVADRLVRGLGRAASLYVNGFNIAARIAYNKVGFQQIRHLQHDLALSPGGSPGAAATGRTRPPIAGRRCPFGPHELRERANLVRANGWWFGAVIVLVILPR
ncbi:hypothetical protein GCM10020366_06970 [Saccharopolyspora gregorii]|uniref:GCN5-related N-acetyltransferase Rv2170-like domain-containing protein n=1 Tax=Saccharopolyspora gregorii TaxID=33914 RepID=A0ABP6RHK5_9PSEU